MLQRCAQVKGDLDKEGEKRLKQKVVTTQIKGIMEWGRAEKAR